LHSNLDTTTAQQEAEKLSNDLTETLKPINKSLETIKAMKDHLNTAQEGTDFETLKSRPCGILFPPYFPDVLTQ
jgi:hypothetical protein